MSFTMQPAPLIRTDPTKNFPINTASGKCPASVAIAMLHAPGRNSNQMPENYVEAKSMSMSFTATCTNFRWS